MGGVGKAIGKVVSGVGNAVGSIVGGIGSVVGGIGDVVGGIDPLTGAISKGVSEASRMAQDFIKDGVAYTDAAINALGGKFGNTLIPGFDPILGNPLKGDFMSGDALITPTGNFTKDVWEDMYDYAGDNTDALDRFYGYNQIADQVAPAIAGYYGGPLLSEGLSSIGSGFGQAAGTGAGEITAGTGAQIGGSALGDLGGLTGSWGGVGGGITGGSLGAGGSAIGDLGGMTGDWGSIAQNFSNTGTVGDLSGLSGNWGKVSQTPDTLGSFIQNLPSGRLEGSGVTPSSAWGNFGSNAIGNTADKMGLGQVYDTLSGLFNAPGLASNLGNTIKGGTSLLDAWNQIQQARQQQDLYRQMMDASKVDQQNFLSQQAAYRDNLSALQKLYSPDSPYAEQARADMMRRDAARGRRSNYGGRATELAGMLTQNQANLMNSPQYQQLLGAANAQYRSPVIPKPNVSSLYGKALSTGFGGAGNLLGGLKGLFGAFS